MTATAQEAYDQFEAAAIVAEEAYLKYWLDRFNNAGVPLTADPTYGGTLARLKYDIYELDGYVMPRIRNGITIKVHCKSNPTHPYDHWMEVKIKSDSGFEKFMRKLSRQQFT